MGFLMIKFWRKSSLARKATDRRPSDRNGSSLVRPNFQYPTLCKHLYNIFHPHHHQHHHAEFHNVKYFTQTKKWKECIITSKRQTMNPKDRRKVEFPPQLLAKTRQFFLPRYLCHICDVADIFVKIAKKCCNVGDVHNNENFDDMVTQLN